MKNGMTASRRKKAKSQLPKQKRIKLPGNNSAANPFKIEWPQTGGTKLVGAYIPKREADYLNLLALHKGTTCSSLVRQAIQYIMETGEQEDQIVEALVKQAINEWESRLKNNQDESGWIDRIDIMARYREYQQELRLLLVKRSIADELIVRIIRRFEIVYGGI